MLASDSEPLMGPAWIHSSCRRLPSQFAGILANKVRLLCYGFLIFNICLTYVLLSDRPFHEAFTFAPTPSTVEHESKTSVSLWSKISSAKDVLKWSKPAASSYDPILNSTLGFQGIYVLSLPDNRERVQPMLKGAEASNLNLTLVDAVRDKYIPKEEWPETWKQDDHAVGILGCLTSHVRMWTKMVSEKIESALILEDDADWDLRIHSILQGVRPAVTALIDYPFAEPPSIKTPKHPHGRASKAINPAASSDNPFGSEWDLLIIGHCSSHLSKGSARFIAWNDTTAPPHDQTATIDLGRGPGDNLYDYGTRSMFMLEGDAGFACTYGYAISQRGAQRMIKYMKKVNGPVDLLMSAACSQMGEFNCAIMWPQIIQSAGVKSSIDYDAKIQEDKKKMDALKKAQEDAKKKEEEEKKKKKEGVEKKGKEVDKEKGDEKKQSPKQNDSSDRSKELSRLRRHISTRDADSANSEESIEVVTDIDETAARKERIKSLVDKLPPGGKSLQYSARRNAPLILDEDAGPMDLVSSWGTMYSEVDKEIPGDEGSSDDQRRKSLPPNAASILSGNPSNNLRNRTIPAWEAIPLDPMVAFDPKGMGEGLPWLKKSE